MGCTVVTAFSWKLPTVLQRLAPDTPQLQQIVGILSQVRHCPTIYDDNKQPFLANGLKDCVLNVGSIVNSSACSGECSSTCQTVFLQTDPPHGDQRLPLLFANCRTILKRLVNEDIVTEAQSHTAEYETTLPNMTFSNADQENSDHLLCIQFRRCTVFALDAYLAHEVFKQLRASIVFRKSFRLYVYHFGKTIKCALACNDSVNQADLRTIIMLPSLILVQVLLPVQEVLDYKWTYRVHGLVHKKIQLEDAMNWLNTLGGGYSALGEYLLTHAEEAGRIARRQLVIAQEMGNTPIVIRCHLYFALSRMQVGDLRTAKKIIRYAYAEIRSLPINDRSLYAIAHALWNRLKYNYRIRQLRNVLFPGSKFDIPGNE